MINDNRLIKLTQTVISYNSENPPGNELALSKFIENDMRSLGIEVKLYTFERNRPNIVATLKGKSPNAKKNSMLLTPHFDTVPIGGGWTRPLLSRLIASTASRVRMFDGCVMGMLLAHL